VTTVRIDARGRVTIPRRFREDLSLAPGDPVHFERVEGGLIIRPLRSGRRILRRLRGVVTAKNAIAELDPMDLKHSVWRD